MIVTILVIYPTLIAGIFLVYEIGLDEYRLGAMGLLNS